MKQALIFVAIVYFGSMALALACNDSIPQPKIQIEIIRVNVGGEDSLIYEAWFRCTEMDSVREGLKDHAEPLKQFYTPKTKGH